MTRDPWKLVTSAGELRPGMRIELRPNAETGKIDRVLLSRLDPRKLICPTCKLMGPTKFDWFAAARDGHYCFVNAIPERRLYALIDDDTAADETTVTRRREMVK